jgi:hypothetical protein
MACIDNFSIPIYFCLDKLVFPALSTVWNQQIHASYQFTFGSFPFLKQERL